jgi:SSS family solute:Na+ symporter
VTTPDWGILFLYLAGTVFIGVFLGRFIKGSSDMFAAGGKSPWWISGLSAFMTMFSANTFVVWGGIAYEHGLVAIMINLCYGVAAIAVGFTVAGKWKKLGIETPADYIEQRFGRPTLHFYTWFMMVFRIVGTGGALYAIARLTLAVIGSGEGGLSGAELNVAILIFALIVVGYTMIGGLWAVLMTDTLQFIILNLAVLFVIPLSLARSGGFSGIVEKLPEGFLAATNDEYTFLFLAGWVAIHYFMIGAEWAFVQRYLCVPTPKDARKSTFLFGGLYLFSPFLWLLPPILWRIQQPIPAGADPETITHMAETAYILSCKAVLPIGMLGLMLAALFSATASMISSQLNVFSGVLTENMYKPLAGNPSDKQMVRMGRVFTCLLGLIVAAIAVATPYLGGRRS